MANRLAIFLRTSPLTGICLISNHQLMYQCLIVFATKNSLGHIQLRYSLPLLIKKVNLHH